jgi:hypothetical protein
MAKSLDFRPSLMTAEAIKALEGEGYFPAGKDENGWKWSENSSTIFYFYI